MDLLEKILMWVLCHLSAFISIKEHVINVEGSSHKGLLVGSSNTGRGRCLGWVEGIDRPQAFSNWADIKVNLDFVVLKGDEWEGKSRVATEPEEEWNIESGLRKSIARSADLGRSSVGRARSRDRGKVRIGDVGELGGVSDHLEVSALLFRRHGELVPDVHPITILAINALASDLNFDLGNQLLTNEIKPSGINTR